MRPLTSPSALILTRIAAAMLVVSALSAGVLTATGSAKRGEANTAEQLGNDSINLSKVPVNVSGLTADVASIKETQRYTCVVTATRGAKCWGPNSYGQLGYNGSDSNVPGDVVGLTSGVGPLSGGTGHSCALTTSGRVACGGSKSSGPLGDGNATALKTPVAVFGSTSGVTGLTTGTGHTCALTTSKGVKCWGLNADGQLGNNSKANSRVPVDVRSLTAGVALITAGGTHSCAVTSKGPTCWVV